MCITPLGAASTTATANAAPANAAPAGAAPAGAATGTASLTAAAPAPAPGATNTQNATANATVAGAAQITGNEALITTLSSLVQVLTKLVHHLTSMAGPPKMPPPSSPPTHDPDGKPIVRPTMPAVSFTVPATPAGKQALQILQTLHAGGPVDMTRAHAAFGAVTDAGDQAILKQGTRSLATALAEFMARKEQDASADGVISEAERAQLAQVKASFEMNLHLGAMLP